MSEARALTVPAVAEQLGVSDMYVYKLIRSGELRTINIALPGAVKSKIRVRADDLAEYIDKQTQPPRASAQ